MTTRTMGSMAAALLAAAGLCSAARSDNKGNPQGASGISPRGATPDSKPDPKQPGLAPAGSDADWETTALAFSRYKAETKPSRDATMQFSFSTEVRDILARGGTKVKKGDVLVRARDSEIIAAINQQKDLAENDLEIRGAQKQAELAKFKFDRLKGSGTAAPTEFEEARITAEVAAVQSEQARKNKIQQDLKLKQFEGQYERYALEAPFDGIIEEVMVEVGQGCTEQEKVLRIVNTDKMWLDPYADTKETIRLALKEGSPAWVLIDMPDAPKMVKGKVLYVSPVAESVSQTRRVRVEIDNPQGWPAGTQARVRFTEPGGEWKKYIATNDNSFSANVQLDAALTSEAQAMFKRVVTERERGNWRRFEFDYCDQRFPSEVSGLSSFSFDSRLPGFILPKPTLNPAQALRTQGYFDVADDAEVPFWAMFIRKPGDFYWGFAARQSDDDVNPSYRLVRAASTKHNAEQSSNTAAKAGENSPQSNDEIRRVIAEVLSNPESRASLLAGGDAGHDGRFFIAGNGSHQTTTSVPWTMCAVGLQLAKWDMPPIRSDAELGGGTLIIGPPAETNGRPAK